MENAVIVDKKKGYRLVIGVQQNIVSFLIPVNVVIVAKMALAAPVTGVQRGNVMHLHIK
jgi:hypothetical protein